MKNIGHDKFLKDIESDFNKIGSKIDKLNKIMGVLFFTNLLAIFICIIVFLSNLK